MDLRKLPTSLPPVPSVLPNASGTPNNPRAKPAGPDFQSRLNSQSRPHLLPPDPVSTQALSESIANLSRRPDVEVMLQSLAWRKNARSASCGNDLIADVPCWGGLNAAAIAVALSGSTLIWVPFEPIRAPLQSPHFRVLRRRKAVAAEGLPAGRPLSSTELPNQ
ncbi:hypothetical protein H7698_25460 [Pseudomonas sp. p50]|uniref:hypothetical protein n=1 Tax=Pseudomonas sp. p50(2008) TaxID=2816832 RepID=UPI00188C53C6|nr:hypothetical protein [Pseudomonas sp. p50(2008)]MBF4559423.1 hypothetical protein [Pseudomonas sp. p50(2008)]